MESQGTEVLTTLAAVISVSWTLKWLPALFWVHTWIGLCITLSRLTQSISVLKYNLVKSNKCSLFCFLYFFLLFKYPQAQFLNTNKHDFFRLEISAVPHKGSKTSIELTMTQKGISKIIGRCYLYYLLERKFSKHGLRWMKVISKSLMLIHKLLNNFKTWN